MKRKPKAAPRLVNRVALKGSDSIHILSFKDSRGRWTFGYEVAGQPIQDGFWNRSMAVSLAEFARDNGQPLYV